MFGITPHLDAVRAALSKTAGVGLDIGEAEKYLTHPGPGEGAQGRYRKVA